MSDSWQDWFEAAWAHREECIYQRLFGDLGPGIFPLDMDLFLNVFSQESVDPRWLHLGVFESPANESRPTWLYVSSGLSNAWEASQPEPDGWSGLGCEFLLQTKTQSPWALLLVRRLMAFQVLLAHGRYSGKEILEYGDRIPLKGAIDFHQSALTWALLWPSNQFKGAHQLPSGRFEFIEVLGITEREAEFARERGCEELVDMLENSGFAPVVSQGRSELALAPN